MSELLLWRTPQWLPPLAGWPPPGWLPPAPRDAWLGCSASALTKRTCYFFSVHENPGDGRCCFYLCQFQEGSRQYCVQVFAKINLTVGTERCQKSMNTKPTSAWLLFLVCSVFDHCILTGRTIIWQDLFLPQRWIDDRAGNRPDQYDWFKIAFSAFAWASQKRTYFMHVFFFKIKGPKEHQLLRAAFNTSLSSGCDISKLPCLFSPSGSSTIVASVLVGLLSCFLRFCFLWKNESDSLRTMFTFWLHKQLFLEWHFHSKKNPTFAIFALAANARQHKHNRRKTRPFVDGN